MFQVGDYLVYKREVCLVKELKENYMNGLDYFVLVPKADPSLKIEIPINSKAVRKLIDIEEVENIINTIPSVELIIAEDKMLEHEYKRLLNSGTHEDLIRIIKTTYMRNQERLAKKKKIGDKDNRYLEQAEKDLYNEFGTVLNMSFDDTKEYVINKVKNLT